MQGTAIIVDSALILAALAVPGLAVTLAVFPKWGQIGLAERLGLSFILGVMPQLAVYFASVNFGVPINAATSTASMVGVTVLGLAVWRMRLRSAEPAPA
jgi:hypothetical protein